MTSLTTALTIIAVLVGGLLVIAFFVSFGHLIINAGLLLVGIVMLVAGIAANSVGGGFAVFVGLVFAFIGGFNLWNIIKDKEYYRK